MEEKEVLEDKKKKEEYIKCFGKVFGIENLIIDTTKLPLLKYIVQVFGEEIYTPTKEYRRLIKKEMNLFEELEETFTKEQTEKFLEYCELSNEITGEREEQLFMFGFIMAREIEKELNYIKNTKLLKNNF